jgi:long-chain acyl-CoA synthetase
VSDPLALVPLAAGAHGGRIDGVETRQLIAAGLTLLARCAPLVRALSGRRSAVLLPASAAYLTALAASEGRGAVLLNPLATSHEIVWQLEDAGVGAVFTIRPLASRLPAKMARVLLDDAPRSATFAHGENERQVDLGSHAGLELAGDPDVPGRGEEAVIVYTSAMAGVPLGAILTHRNLLANARSTIEAGQLSTHDHALAVLPASHLFGLTVTLLAPLLAGGQVTTMERFNPVRALELLDCGGITMLVGVPAVFAGLLAALDRRGGGLDTNASTLRLCICGGAPLAPQLQERWEEMTGVALRQGYGLTEAGPVCLFNRVDHPNRPGALGMPMPGVRVTIRDPGSSEEVPPGTTGEISVAGENVFAGYVSGGTDGLRMHGEWLHTGDLGEANANGVVVFRGWQKAMFTRNGFNIYPRELERAVRGLEGVRAVTVRAIPHPAREHDIALDVVGTVEVEEVRRWCEERLSSYKQPSEIRIIPP